MFTLAEFVRWINVPANRICQIVISERSNTGDAAFRVGRRFGVEPEFWPNLIVRLDLVDEREAGNVIRQLPTRIDRSSGSGPVDA